MKEQIYTIPVTEAFRQDCECPMCFLESNLETGYIDYFLGPSLMEPDCRIETNDTGFCRRHFQLLYNKQENRLGLGLIIDTHLTEQNLKLKKAYEGSMSILKDESSMPLLKSIASKFSSRQTGTDRTVDHLISLLDDLEKKCAVCSKLEYTMGRYIDVILYLWFKEQEFKKLFNSTKGFCLNHLKQLLIGTKKYLKPREAAIFVQDLMSMQLENMERIQKEVNWFTKKFDYRYNDAPWGNSRDAIPRSIQKIVGFCDLK